jgi:streptogramin lyase
VSDYDRMMREALKSASESYRPSDPYAARQEFFRRRRRRRVWVWAGGAVAAGATAAAAFIAFAILDASPETDRQGARTVTPAVSAREVDLARIRVGNGPDGVAIGEGYVWVVNAESRTLSRVDPATDAVETVNGSMGEQPEDLLVAHGSVWVTDRGTGDIYRYDPATDETEIATQIGTGTDLDIAAGETNDIWIAEVGGELHRIDSTGNDLGSWAIAENLADVSFIDSEAWAYDEGTGEIVRFDSATEEVTSHTQVGVSDSADLVAGLRYVWFYRGSDGRLLQIDRQTARVVKRFAVGGTFGSLTIGEDSLWAMVTEGGPEGSGDGRLYRIDVDDAVEIQEPIPVSDTPYDLAAGYGSVWATNFTADQVTRVDLSTGAAPQPTVAETPTGEVVFYYSDGEDIFSYYQDSTVAPIASSSDPELSPTISPDGSILIFQRGERNTGDQPELISVDLTTGEEIRLGRGGTPAFGPHEEAAWVVNLVGGELAIAVGSPLEDSYTTFPLAPAETLYGLLISHIAWDSNGDSLYFQRSSRNVDVAVLDLQSVDPQPAPVAPEAAEDGSVLVAPSVREPGVLTAIQLCCRHSPDFDFTTAELVEITGDPGSGWGPAEKVLGIDDVLPPGYDLFAVPAGNLDYETDGGWTTDDNRAWLVGDGDQLYLMDESGEKDLLGLSGVKGLVVVPQYGD